MKAWSPNHCTTREFPCYYFLPCPIPPPPAVGIQRLKMKDGREIQGEPFPSLRNKVSYYQICRKTYLGFYKMTARLCFISIALAEAQDLKFQMPEVFWLAHRPPKQIYIWNIDMAETGLPLRTKYPPMSTLSLIHVSSCLKTISNIFHLICINVWHNNDDCKLFAASSIEKWSQIPPWIWLPLVASFDHMIEVEVMSWDFGG